MKCITAYKFEDQILIHAMSQTVDGFWVLEEPCKKIPCECSDNELGSLCKTLLGNSRTGVPNPSRDEHRSRSLLKLAGVRSFRIFAKQAILVNIEQDGSVFSFYPTRYLGDSQGFEEINDRSFGIKSPSDQKFGQSLQDALNLSEGW